MCIDYADYLPIIMKERGVNQEDAFYIFEQLEEDGELESFLSSVGGSE